jgi:hypothetical protein
MPRTREDVEKDQAKLTEELASIDARKEKAEERRDEAEEKASDARTLGNRQMEEVQNRIAKASSDEIATLTDLMREVLARMKGQKVEEVQKEEAAPKEQRRRGYFDAY